MIFSTAGLEFFFNRTTFGVERLSVKGDAERLSWVRGREFGLPAGNNFLEKSTYEAGKCVGRFLFFSGLTCTLTVTGEGEAVRFRYLYKNDTKKTIRTEVGELGIYLPFNDEFTDPVIALRRRVHAHIRTQGGTYIYCERYSGDLPAMGLVVTKGESQSYSLERGAKRASRGTFVLELPAISFAEGEEYEFEFVLFPCTGREDFYKKAEEYGLLTATASELAVFSGEEIVVKSANASTLTTEKGEIPFVDGECRFVAEGEGEKTAIISGKEQSLLLRYFVLHPDLKEKRLSFLTERQYLSEGKYAGAFTAFDHTSDRQVLRKGVRSPFSLAGFRAAPLLLLLREGQAGILPPERKRILDDAIAFYDREIYRGGEVSDDVGGKRTRLFKRYYNYPLYATIKYEEYRYADDLVCLIQAATILVNLYKSGSLYEVAPVLPVVEALKKEGKVSLAAELGDVVLTAADTLIKSGNKYASFKGLPYGPEIVYGALSTLLDAYFLSDKEYYLQTAKEHLARLETFSFPSLDYATDQVPEIFQRDRGSGLTYDMSPHFTAVHFAVVYEKYFRATGESRYRDLAERILRASLTLFDKTGRSVRSKAAPRLLNDLPLKTGEQISCGEDVVLYHFGLLFECK